MGRRIFCAAALAAVALVLVLAPAAFAAPDRTFTLTPGTASEWDGPPTVASNQNYDATSGGPCGKDPDNYCDITLLNVGARDDSFYKTHQSTLKIDAGNFTVPANDFDLYVYESDAAGNQQGAPVGSSGQPPGLAESVTIKNPSGYYLVKVVYFATTGGYHGTALLTDKDQPPLVNADVDNPPGVPESLASNPALGYRSHSEPHIAQSPTNPNILIAGSKQYNRDPDSLKEYEFKIGTYVSFDRGRTWTDLGQIDLCPRASDAPPSSWPDNTCYPGDDPDVGGTGPEDAKDSRGHTDYGEEYVVSDIWMDFDDEGNAYAMVLDSPPFADAAGWGMSFHKWTTPSPEDVARGDTWGKKVVINDYPQEKGNVEKESDGTTDKDNGSNPAGFLDDKNTFAVNNAGKDGDGKTGPILACWGQNIETAIKQQTVCKHSTDGGKSFPGSPIPVSGEQQLVLGVHTLADRKDPNTFYVTWKSYATNTVGGIVFPVVSPEHEQDDLGIGFGAKPTILYMAKTTDGGQTFTPAHPIATFDDLASPLPGSEFRTGAIPISAEAPNGDIYVVFDAYNDAPDAAHDADGKTADVDFIKSTDGGTTFTRPAPVNQDHSNADQFQGHVAVAPNGEVNVAFFDRRLDPQNYFVDEWLARSSDGGAHWKETRLSHDASDPAVNPPTSPSGAFFGDYQGLVADKCQSLAFYQDTHLANDPARDPDFDQGDPRSQFQEVFAYRDPRPGSANDLDCAPPPKSVRGFVFACYRTPPASSIIGKSLRARHRRLRARGKALDRKCKGSKRAGKVKRVKVAVWRKVGKRCRFARTHGGLTRRRSCRKPHWLRAHVKRAKGGRAKWTVKVKGRLPRGRYTIRSRAIDTDGNAERKVRRANRKHFRVR